MAHVEHGSFLLEEVNESPILRRLIGIGSCTEKHLKRSDTLNLKITDAIQLFCGFLPGIPLNVIGLFLLGVTRVYFKKLDQFGDRIVMLVDGVGSSTGAQREPSTSRKRTVLHQTPLAMVPEDEALLLQGDVNFEVPALLNSVGRTPYSSRKRLFGTPRSQSVEEEVPEFGPTMILQTPQGESNRRLSSVSEVMDSLRADDGQRRLSNLLGTVSPQNFDNELDVPASPWVFDTPLVGSTPMRRKRGMKKRAHFMDKKGKWGIEINPADLESRMRWYLENPFYMKSKNVDITLRISVRELLTDRTGHFVWYKGPPPQVKVRQDPEIEFEPMNDFEMNDDAWVENPTRKSLSLKESVACNSGKSVQNVLESVSRDRKNMVENFLNLLTLASASELRIARAATPLGFNDASSSLVFAN